MLFKAAKIVLLTIHSNAEIKWVYPLVNKSKRLVSEQTKLKIEDSFPKFFINLEGSNKSSMHRAESKKKWSVFELYIHFSQRVKFGYFGWTYNF